MVPDPIFMDDAPFANGLYTDGRHLGLWDRLYLRAGCRSLPDRELAQRYRKGSRNFPAKVGCTKYIHIPVILGPHLVWQMLEQF